MAEVTVERDGGVAWVRYRSPANRLTALGLLRLRRALDDLDPEVRVVVLCAADGRFPTLMDPGEGRQLADAIPPLPPRVIAAAAGWGFRLLRRSRLLRRLLDGERWALRTAFLNTLLLEELLEGGHRVTIAALRGPVFGGGMELALCCDLRIAEDGPHTWLALPEILAGVMVGFGSSQRLPRLVGRARALEFLLLGEPLDPRRALAWGLVNRVSPADAFDADLRALAHRLAGRAPAVVAGTRRAVRAADPPLALSAELREVVGVWRTAEAHAGLARVGAILERQVAEPERTLPEWIRELGGSGGESTGATNPRADRGTDTVA